MTESERDDVSRVVPFGDAGRALLVQEFSNDVALAELFASANLSTFLPSPWNPTTGEYEDPVPCLAIGCCHEDQVRLFDANEAKITDVLQRLGYRFGWVTAGMCI